MSPLYILLGITKRRIHCIHIQKESSKPEQRVIVVGKSTKDLTFLDTLKLSVLDLNYIMLRSKM